MADLYSSNFRRSVSDDIIEQCRQPVTGETFVKGFDESPFIDRPDTQPNIVLADAGDQVIAPSSTSPAGAALPYLEQTSEYLRFTLGIKAPQVIDLTVLPDHPWPPGITKMIKLAIWGSEGKMLTLSQIYAEIEKRFPARRSGKDTPWKKSIRHNLSYMSVFVKVERPSHHPGKGCYWTLDFSRGEGHKRRAVRREARDTGTWSPEDGCLVFNSRNDFDGNEILPYKIARQSIMARSPALPKAQEYLCPPSRLIGDHLLYDLKPATDCGAILPVPLQIDWPVSSMSQSVPHDSTLAAALDSQNIPREYYEFEPCSQYECLYH